MLKEIQKQPEHIRELIMWLCVVIVFAGVVYFWFGSFQTNLVALLNPEETEIEDSPQLANQSSPFAELKNGFKGLGASIWGLFDFIKQDDETKKQILNDYQKAPVDRRGSLPISK